MKSEINKDLFLQAYADSMRVYELLTYIKERYPKAYDASSIGLIYKMISTEILCHTQTAFLYDISLAYCPQFGQSFEFISVDACIDEYEKSCKEFMKSRKKFFEDIEHPDLKKGKTDD